MKKINFISMAIASTAAVALVTGCAEDKKARVDQRVVEKAHDPGACPAIADGHYRLQNQNPQQIIPSFVDISRNDGREILLSFDNGEKYMVNGKEQPHADGSKMSFGCAANAVRVAGTDSKGQRVKYSLVPTQKGLDLQQSEPTKQTSNYEKTSILGTAIDKAIKPLDQTPSPSGLPNADDVNKK